MSFFRPITSLAVIVAFSFITATASGAGEKAVLKRKTAKSAPKTPLGVYQKQVTDAIGSRWYAYIRAKADLFTVGTLRMNFRILANGRVTGLKVLSNTSNEAFASVCRQAVLESKFPPIPEAVRRQIHQDFIDWDGVNFIMHPN